MKKDKFEKCNLDLLLFACEDVIKTSNPDVEGGEEPFTGMVD